MTVSEDLASAARVLEMRGWCQKENQNAEGNVCIVGAIRLAVHGSADSHINDFETRCRFHIARNMLHKSLKAPPTNWNDTLGRTAAEAYTALIEAAKFSVGV